MACPKISVAMSVHNGLPFLDAAVKSILAQSVGEFEFLIVDDGSSDGSRELLQDHARADPRIRLMVQENRGLIASLNRLIEAARAPVIARMDGDDIAHPERFERQLAFLHAHPDHGVVGAQSDCIDGQGNSWAEPMQLPTTHEAFLKAIEQGGQLLCHSAVMMRTDVVRAAGGYHPAYKHCEDYDLWLRLSERTKLCSLPDRLIRYRHSDGQVSSRHVLAQQTGAAIAWFAHRERLAGRPDPTAHLDELPPIGELDALFGRKGIGRAVRAKVAHNIVYSPVALRGEGYELILSHVQDGGETAGLWRTAARLLKMGEIGRAARLAAALASR